MRVIYRISRKVFFLLFVKQLLISAPVSAQPIKGKVTDAYTNEPVAFANILFKGTTRGTMTDFNGDYRLIHTGNSDTLIFSFIGYEQKLVPVSDADSIIHVQLFPSVYALQEVVVKPGENPAHEILRKVWENSDRNNFEKLHAFQYENYSRSTVYLRKFNFKDSTGNTGFFRKEFDNYSVSTGDEGIPALPAYISESVSDVYFLKDPKREYNHIKAVKSNGLAFGNTDLVSQLTSKQENFNFLNNTVPVIDKSFVSPLSRFGLLYYKYYLIDSLFIGDRFCYEIQVKPRHEENPLFKGTVWITDSTYALRRISVEIGKKADLNFIQRIKIQQDYLPCDSAWFPVKTRFMADAVNLFITNYSEKNQIVVNRPEKFSFYGQDLKTDFQANDFDEEYWKGKRNNSLEKIDSAASLQLADLKKENRIRIPAKITEAAIKGYYPSGPFEWGPFLLFYGYNTVEGNRLRVGGRTNHHFSRNWILEGYLAYGFKDNRVKGSLRTERFLIKKYWTKIGFQLKDDVAGVGSTDEFFSKSSFLTLASSFGGTNKLSETRITRLWFESDLFNDINIRIILSRNAFTPLSPDFHFAYYSDNTKTETKNSFVNSEAGISLSYQPKVTWVLDGVRRFSVNFNKYPCFTFSYFHGLKSFFGGDFSYQKISAGIFHNFTLGALGIMIYEINYNRVFDPVPYPLLSILPGNESVFRSNRTFNLMNLGEFAADETVELFYSWHMDGLILNKIPLVNKLHWRTVTTGHFAFGRLDKRNSVYDPLLNPVGIIPPADPYGNEITPFYTLSYSKPYVEFSYGIENIFRFFRIDLIQRLNYPDHPDVKKTGLKISGVFRF